MSEVSAEPLFAYDEVAYPATVIAEQAPEHIRAMGLLHGWSAADPSRASILEIGCGDGLNLAAIAAVAPNARCVGFDLSGSAVERGWEMAGRAGLDNLDLHQGDIMDYPRTGPGFDYILCHGVYSWVPPPVRPALIDLIRARLAPGGVAYLGFDALPACSAKAAINRLIVREVAGIGDVEERFKRTGAIIGALHRHQHAESRLKPALDFLVAEFPKMDPGYFYHDWMAEFYDPIALPDFRGALDRNGLKSGGDGDLFDIFNADLDQDAKALVDNAGSDWLDRSMVLDLLRGSHTFRRELVVRKDAPPHAASRPLRQLRYTFLGTVDEVDRDGVMMPRYCKGPRIFIVPQTELLRRVLGHLHEIAPDEASYDDLLRLTDASDQDLESALSHVVRLGVVEVHSTPQPFVTIAGDRPRAGQLIRATMETSDRCPTLRHTALSVDNALSRMLLILCDGTRDRAGLHAEMSARFGQELDPDRVEGAIKAFGQRRVFEA